MTEFNKIYCKYRMRLAIKKEWDPNGPAGQCVSPYCSKEFPKCKQVYTYGDRL